MQICGNSHSLIGIYCIVYGLLFVIKITTDITRILPTLSNFLDYYYLRKLRVLLHLCYLVCEKKQ